MPSRKTASPPSSRSRTKTSAKSSASARKAAQRSSSSARATAGRGTQVRGAAKGATRIGKPSAAAAKRAPSAANRPAKGSAGQSFAGSAKPAARKRAPVRDVELVDVTDEIQRRYDTEEDDVPTPPSSLNLDRHASAARTGGEQMKERRRKHTAASPEISAGDVDADWEGAYFVGDEAATSDNPTPGQVTTEEVGRAVGNDYEDTEELKFTDKITKRDRHRWELDPASSEDYKDRVEGKRKKR